MRCWTASFLLYWICNRRKIQTSPMLTSASWRKSGVYFSTVIFKPFFCLNRNSRSLEEVWETCQSIFRSRTEATCAVRPKELSQTIYTSFQQGKGNSSLLLMWFSFCLKQDYKPATGPLALAVGAFLKDKPFRNTPHFSWAVSHSH